MKKYWLISLCSLLVWSCTEIEVEDQELPSLDGLTIDNMETELPIFSLTTDPDDFDRLLKSPGKTILIDGTLAYRDENGNDIFDSIGVQVEVKGKSSAFKKMKSLGIIFDSLFDNSQFEILDPPTIVANHSLTGLYAVRFRNSGNDFGQSMLKDISYTALAIQADVDFELMYYRQCQFFVNEEYYGLLNLRTENNLLGMSGLQAVTPDDISVVKVDLDNGNLEWDEGSTEMAEEFEDALEDEDAETIWGLIDESSFIDYLIFQDYIGNHDWPHNNARMYSRNGQPFRFVLYDTDFAAFNNKNPLLPEMEYRDDDLSKLYQEMRKKPGFDERLEQRQKELYKRFSDDIFEDIVDRHANIIEDELPYFMARYGEPFSMLHWHMRLDLIKREFRLRDKHIRDKYDL